MIAIAAQTPLPDSRIAPRPAPQKPIVLIPARMSSTRLPGKPLADIHGEPMIVHVWRRATESGIGPVVVACAEREIAEAVKKAGGEAILTKPAHPTGSDRIWEALNILDPQGKFDAIVNFQGDVPTLDPRSAKLTYEGLKNPEVDIATLAVPSMKDSDRQATQIVKAVVEIAPDAKSGRALYVTRTPAPWGEGPVYCHIGLYAYRRAALEKFVHAPQAELEKRESLEQLRALALGMRIEVMITDTIPLGVDTPADLEIARELLKK